MLENEKNLYVPVCAFTCMWVCVCVHIFLSFVPNHRLGWGTGSLTKLRVHQLAYVDQPATLRDFPVSASPVLRCQIQAPYSALSMNTEIPSSGLMLTEQAHYQQGQCLSSLATPPQTK